MARIGFNFPLLSAAAPGAGWQTTNTPGPTSRNEEVIATHAKPLAASLRRQLHEKEAGSVILNRRFAISESLEASRKWFEREIQAQMRRGGLFEDPFMPPVDNTIWPERSSSSSRYRWMRPNQIVSNPEFVADGLSRFDIKQGELGDCWLLAALASLSMHKNLLNEVVPGGQSFVPSTDGRPLNRAGGFAYVGMFWFRFWHFGHWVDVVVDDRLPTNGGRLVFMHSSDKKEFWTALIEKAYAKLIGSYGALRGGSTAEGMEDFTGGMTEMIEMNGKEPPNLYSIMMRAHSRCSLLACSIDAKPNEVEADAPLGLIKGHAYSITDVRMMRDSRRMSLQMVRLRNPWGNDREWCGPWSDKSSEWKNIPPEERLKIGLSFDNDGEFWMCFDDFKRYFSRVELCHLSPEFDQMDGKSGKAKRSWEMTRHEGEWLRNSTAGGCRNYIDTFHANPQIRVSVIDADEADDDPTGTIVVGLMQKGMREKRAEPLTIGYSIYQMPRGAPPNALLTRQFFTQTTSTARSPAYINTREICGRHKLMPGDYVIIPSTFAPNEEAKFLLRIFSERPYNAGELDDQISIGVEPALPSKPDKEDDDTAVRLQSAFEAIAGESEDIEAEDLRNILNRVFQNKIGSSFEGFSLETVRSMVALMDVDTSGTLGFDEFKTLWYELRLWQTIFKKADPDGDGYLRTSDLRSVLSKTGITISNEIFKAIVCRYGHKGRINFDDYILLTVRLITVFSKFKENITRGHKKAAFYVDEFLRCVLYT